MALLCQIQIPWCTVMVHHFPLFIMSNCKLKFFFLAIPSVVTVVCGNHNMTTRRMSKQLFSKKLNECTIAPRMLFIVQCYESPISCRFWFSPQSLYSVPVSLHVSFLSLSGSLFDDKCASVLSCFIRAEKQVWLSVLLH